MPGIEARPRAAIYVPHGAIPDRRGFAPAIVAWHFARRLKRFESFFVSAREQYMECHELIDGISVHRIEQGRLYRRLFRKITRLDPWPLHRHLARLLQRESWDLLHAHQLEFPVRDFRRHVSNRCPVLLHAHVTVNRFDPARGEADCYIAASNYVRQSLIEAKSYPAERVVVVHNGVDTQLFAPLHADERQRLRTELGLPHSAPVIAFIGRKQEVKGFDVFLKAVTALTARYDDIRAIAAGPELDEAKLESSYGERQRLRVALQESGHLVELPAMPQTELARVLRVADIALLPSRAEPQGMAMIESMASGCVTVSSDIGGIRESIRHGETGYLLKRPDDVDEAISVCEKVLNSAGQWPSLCKVARVDVCARFDWDVVTNKLEQVYEDVMRTT